MCKTLFDGLFWNLAKLDVDASKHPGPKITEAKLISKKLSVFTFLSCVQPTLREKERKSGGKLPQAEGRATVTLWDCGGWKGRKESQRIYTLEIITGPRWGGCFNRTRHIRRLGTIAMWQQKMPPWHSEKTVLWRLRWTIGNTGTCWNPLRKSRLFGRWLLTQKEFSHKEKNGCSAF